jgi:hypothetical protein
MKRIIVLLSLLLSVPFIIFAQKTISDLRKEGWEIEKGSVTLTPEENQMFVDLLFQNISCLDFNFTKHDKIEVKGEPVEVTTEAVFFSSDGKVKYSRKEVDEYRNGLLIRSSWKSDDIPFETRYEYNERKQIKTVSIWDLQRNQKISTKTYEYTPEYCSIYDTKSKTLDVYVFTKKDRNIVIDMYSDRKKKSSFIITLDDTLVVVELENQFFLPKSISASNHYYVYDEQKRLATYRRYSQSVKKNIEEIEYNYDMQSNVIRSYERLRGRELKYLAYDEGNWIKREERVKGVLRSSFSRTIRRIED